MEIELTPKLVLALWTLLILGDDIPKGQVRPTLGAADWKKLLNAELIEIEKRGRLQFVLLTDKAWLWAAEKPVTTLSRSYDAVPLLRQLLLQLQLFLQQNNILLATFLQPQAPESTMPATLNKEGDPLLDQQIRNAYLHLTGDRYNVRVRLANLRMALTHVPADAISSTLRQMQLNNRLVLMPLDDPKGIVAADREAAVNIGGEANHIIYMKG